MYLGGRCRGFTLVQSEPAKATRAHVHILHMNAKLLTVASVEVFLAQSLLLPSECCLIPQKDIVLISVEVGHLGNLTKADDGLCGGPSLYQHVRVDTA